MQLWMQLRNSQSFFHLLCASDVTLESLACMFWKGIKDMHTGRVCSCVR